ncbi:dihydropteroate synthase [Ruegeria aquimaris]|uniref:Dihydropteroate synthase n=1 Tax=Ruegeria aquimaris TaxID=2984333 RepID=A0ABT3AEI5_9RHOB|nr:dihydropteroate synthase [Ruegeria sp. XHP0148]MCV2887085.1 dihydropteroate synthase [Ruegeria sp. XHP0148]
MSDYFRPLVQQGTARPRGAVPLGGGTLWFTHAERLCRDGTSEVVPAGDVPAGVLDRLTGARDAIAGLEMSRPHLMGILNVTPDSFSDGGRHYAVTDAVQAALAMAAQDVSLLDIGGESTRPGATEVPVDEEIRRIEPVIEAIRAETGTAISIDTRKAAVAEAALAAGASLVNDVSGFTFDAGLAPLCAETSTPVCIMHAQGDPATMQQDPHYDNVLLDVYDFLSTQVDRLVAAGLSRGQIVIDPGIGFGKTQAHNLTLLRNLSLFHGIGCPILLGVSRKRFIGTIGKEPLAEARAPGSISVGLSGLAQGVQILRVHDVAETAQALRLWAAVR